MLCYYEAWRLYGAEQPQAPAGDAGAAAAKAEGGGGGGGGPRLAG